MLNLCIPPIADGPESVASMRHLIRNDCAIIIKDEDDLEDVLLQAFANSVLRERVVGNALKTAFESHVSQTNSCCLYGIIRQIIGDSNQRRVVTEGDFFDDRQGNKV